MSNHQEQYLVAVNMDLQVSLENIREERDELKEEVIRLKFENAENLQVISRLNSVIDRQAIAMSQGQEL
jgi:hypothetical protein